MFRKGSDLLTLTFIFCIAYINFHFHFFVTSESSVSNRLLFIAHYVKVLSAQYKLYMYKEMPQSRPWQTFYEIGNNLPSYQIYTNMAMIRADVLH